MTPGEIFDVAFNSGILLVLGGWVLLHAVNGKIHYSEKFCDERHRSLEKNIKDIKSSVDRLVELHEKE